MSTRHASLWEHQEPCTKFGIEVPEWIESDISPYDVAAILRGGCSSGAYMPAVTYWQARETMDRYGDAIMEIFDESGMDAPKGASWSGLAVFFVSLAVESWAFGVSDELERKLWEHEEGGKRG